MPGVPGQGPGCAGDCRRNVSVMVMKGAEHRLLRLELCGGDERCRAPFAQTRSTSSPVPLPTCASGVPSPGRSCSPPGKVPVNCCYTPAHRTVSFPCSFFSWQQPKSCLTIIQLGLVLHGCTGTCPVMRCAWAGSCTGYGASSIAPHRLSHCWLPS